MKTQKELRQELLLKEQRIEYWERFGTIPSMNDLVLFNDANTEMGA